MRLSTRAGHTRPRPTNPPWHRPVAVVVSYALVMVGLATGGLAVTPVPADAAPNTTGPAPTVVFTDTLDHGSPTPRLISRYRDASNSFTADRAALRDCRGWLVGSGQSASSGAPVLDCGGTVSGQALWNRAQQLGASVADADPEVGRTSTNRALSLVSTEGSTLKNGSTVLSSSATAPVTSGGRFLLPRLDLAQTACSSPRRLQTSLIDGRGRVVNAGAPMDACAGRKGTVAAAGRANSTAVTVDRVTADRAVLWTGSRVGLGVSTKGTSTSAAVLDNPTVLDATPRLTMAFSPAKIRAGRDVTLTATITNTSDLAAKPGFSLTASLPPGLRVAVTVLLAATALAGCSGSNSAPTPSAGATSAPPVSASPSRSAEISPPSLTPIPTLSKEKGIVVDTTMTACSTKPGTVTANGTVRNSGSSASDLVVVVSWVLPQGNDVLARGVAVVKKAKPGAKSDWKVSTTLKTNQTVQCVLSSRRGSL